VRPGPAAPDQPAGLRDLYCQYGQGCLFAKPLPRDEAEELLGREPRW
jgi:EAL domain-containing protein (putative c-di-GMP-specific phosphodiesterase class I)